jgi:hypothetical protein
MFPIRPVSRANQFPGAGRSSRLQRARRRRRPLMLDYLEERTLLSTTYTVNALTDTGARSGLQGDLGYAITQTDSHAGSTIQFSVTGTITLGSALPALSAKVTITGPGASSLTVSGDKKFRVFDVDANVTAS